MKQPKLTEHEIQSAILDWLKAHRYFFWRNNTGAFGGEHKGKRWFVRFGRPGAPDIFVCYAGRIYGIEVKSPEGRLSVAQEAFQFEFFKNGGHYIVARSLDDVIAALPMREG